MFQFPTNGKVSSDTRVRVGNKVDALSFQFPTNGKVSSDTSEITAVTDVTESFNSLRTGRYLQTANDDSQPEQQPTFQFPTNGKVSSDTLFFNFLEDTGCSFQFPTNGKVSSDVSRQHEWPLKWVAFQFPTNGKVSSDSKRANLDRRRRH